MIERRSVTPKSPLHLLLVTTTCLGVSGIAMPVTQATELSDQFMKFMWEEKYDDARLLINSGMLKDSDKKEIDTSNIFWRLATDPYDHRKFTKSDSETREIHEILSSIHKVEFDGEIGGLFLDAFMAMRNGPVTVDNPRFKMYDEFGLTFELEDIEVPHFMDSLFYSFLDLDEYQYLITEEAASKGIDETSVDIEVAKMLLMPVTQTAVENRKKTVDFILNERGMLRYAEFGIEVQGNVFNAFFSALNGIDLTYRLPEYADIDLGEVQQLWYGYFCDLADRFYHTRLEAPKATRVFVETDYEDATEEALFTMISKYQILPDNVPESCGVLVTKMTGDLENPRALAKRLAETGDTEGMKWVLAQSAQ